MASKTIDTVRRALNRIRVPTPAFEGPDPGLEHAGTVWFRRSNYLFGVVALIAMTFAIIDGSAPLGPRLISVPIMLGVAWWFVDRICTPEFDRGNRSRIYLAVALPVFLLLVVMHPAYRLLAFAAYWQVFAFLRLRDAFVISILLSLGILATFDQGDIRLPLSSQQDWIIFSVSVSCGGLMAAFIHSIMSEAEKRRALIGELESTRSLLAAEERRSGALGERQRIAGEIHDTIAQDLTSVVMHLEAAESRLDSDDSPASTHIDQARTAARSGLNEARRIVQALLPDIVIGNALTAALELTESRWSDKTGIDSSYTLVGDDPGSEPSRDVVLVRGLQEALTNIDRHANATRVRITLTNLEDVLLLDVNDDGEGTELAAARPTIGLGIGLRALEERLRSIDGTLTLESSAGGGTTLSMSVPIATGDTT